MQAQSKAKTIKSQASGRKAEDTFNKIGYMLDDQKQAERHDSKRTKKGF